MHGLFILGLGLKPQPDIESETGQNESNLIKICTTSSAAHDSDLVRSPIVPLSVPQKQGPTAVTYIAK